MADVITRFKLETSQFDSKLRDTAKALQDIAHQASLGGKDFNDFNQKAIESARALGTVQSGANNTKDKLRDLVGSYNDAAKAYNSLTETAKKGEFGQAMSQSLTQLQQRIRETKDELYGLGDGMKGASGGGLFGGGKLDGMIQVFGGNLMTKGAGMALSFAGEMKDMVAQGIELAKQGEGIRIAFERLGRGDILQGLREATHGTVTDLELMKAAVKFNDFKLPLDELGTMLAFAQQKAKDTGQSVDYMVDSIVTGLGRKSLMILDNLGLSAAQIKERMAETGDMTKAVGAIIREEMAKAGDYVETAADRATQANVSMQNKMEELGRKFLPVKQASDDLWTSIKIGILDIVGGPLADLLNGLTRAGQLRNELKNIGSDERVSSDIEKLKGSNYKPQAYQMMLAKYSREEQKALDNYKKAQKGGMGSIAVWENRYLAQKTMREDFQARGRKIAYPTKADAGQNNGLGGTTTTTTTPKVKADTDDFKEMEEVVGLLNLQKQKLDDLQAMKPFAVTEDEIARLNREIETANKEYERLLNLGKEIKSTDLLGKAQKKLADAQQELATAKQTGNLKNIYTAQKKVDTAQSDVDRLKQPVEVPVQITYTESNLDAFIGNLKQQLSQAELGSELYNNLTAQMSDATLLGNLMQTAMKNGIDTAQFNPQELWSKVFSENPGDYISNEEWQKKLGVISQKTGRKLQFNPQTGEIREKPNKGNGGDSESLEKFSKDFSAVTGSVNGILSGIQNLGVEIPEGLAKTIGVIQTISGILTAILTITTAIQATSAADATASWIDAIIPFARGGIVKAFSGTLVGNTYSGDQLRGIDQSGQLYGLNAGEVVLNRAQVGNVASQLSGGMGAMQLSAIITGEQLRLVLNNNGRRTGRGEYVTTNFR